MTPESASASPEPQSSTDVSTRTNVSWIESFVERTEHLPTPINFRRWAAISAIAGVLERRVWTQIYAGKPLFPNLYVFLVGPPASGKTVAMIETRALWKKLPDLFVAPTSMSAASMGDRLAEAKRKIVRPTDPKRPYIEYNSLLIASPELGTLLPSYDPEMMTKLTDLYDCGPYEETKRTKDLKLMIPDAQLNIIASVTPPFLGEFLPASAWDQGFMSRVMMIFSGERIVKPLFLKGVDADEHYRSLVADLKIVSTLYGEVLWTDAAGDLLDRFNREGGKIAPVHPRLQHYNSRRTAHLAKLCVIAAVSRSTFDYRVILDDYRVALDWLVEAEGLMPDVFKAMQVGGDGLSIDELWHFMFDLWMKETKPIGEHRLVQFLIPRIPAHSILRVIETMVKSDMIELIGHDQKGRGLYKPKGEQEHRR